MKNTHLNIGDTLPPFSLKDQYDMNTSIYDIKDKRILICFYPTVMTPSFTLQSCILRDSKEMLDALRLEVITISADIPDKLSIVSERESLNFNMLSDADFKVSKKLGVWGEKIFMGKNYHGIHKVSFLVDEKKRILKILYDLKYRDINCLIKHLEDVFIDKNSNILRA